MKKNFLLLIVLFLLLLFSTSCRQKTPVETTETYDGIELTYYKVFDDTEALQELIQDYEVAHPGLQINYRKFSDFDEYQRTVLNEMAEGEGPDIFSMQNTWFAGNVKKLAPMPESIGNAELFESIFVDVASKDLVLVGEDGVRSVFGIPYTVDTLALYYNKDHFEDKLPVKGKPSTTWEGIKEDVIALNKEDDSFDRFEVSGIAMGRADNIQRAVDILYLLFLQYDVDFYDDVISKATFAKDSLGSFQNPGLEALELFVSFADASQKHYSWNEFTVDDDSLGKEVEAFAEGKVSMIVGFAYAYDEIVNYIDLLDSQGKSHIDKGAIRIATIPQVIDPKVSTDKRVTYASYFAETVSRNSEYQELAWDFLVYMSKAENLEKYFEKTHNPTSRRDMIEQQKQDPIYGIFASQVGFAESFPIIEYYTYKDIFSQVINDQNLGGGTGMDLIEAQNRITDLLPSEGLLYEEVIVEETSNNKEGDASTQ